MGSLTKVSEMNMEWWNCNLGYSKGWSEVHTQADSFRSNAITSYIADKLKIEYLKSELRIKKYFHRLEIMAAINDLNSTASREGENRNIKASLSSTSPYTDTLNDRLTNKGSGYIHLASKVSYPNPTAPSLWLAKSADVNNYSVTVSPGCSNKCSLSKRGQEVKKWVDSRNKSFLATKSNKSLADNCPMKNGHHTADRVKAKSKRASPGKQIVYKALRKVTIQKGKTWSSCIVGQLLKNSIVIINQVKGRRGRIVLRKPNGELLVVGWVPLSTSKGRLLLVKYHKKGAAEVQNLDAVIEWKTKSPLDEFKTTAVQDSKRNRSPVETSKNLRSLNKSLNDPHLCGNIVSH